MADDTIHISPVLLKELKSITYKLLILMNDFETVDIRLQHLYEAFASVCEEIDRREV